MSAGTALDEAKLRGLIREATGNEIECIESPGVAGGFVASWGTRGRVGVVMVDGLDRAQAIRSLGPALLWAAKHGLESLAILASAEVAGHLARRAGELAGSDRSLEVEVLVVDGTALRDASPVDVLDIPVLGPKVWAMAGLITEAGARAVDDHGRLVAEFAGLEVARVVDYGDEVLLEVGVGQADRELHQLVHRHLDADASLRRAIDAVAVHRHATASPHPLNRLARERWLRSSLLDRPSLVGLTVLDPIPPLRPRDTLLGSQPVAAVGTDEAGRPVVVVCSVGVEVDVAAEAADYRLRTDPTARLVLAIAPRDRYPIVERLVGLLDRAELVTVPTPWANDLSVDEGR